MSMLTTNVEMHIIRVLWIRGGYFRSDYGWGLCPSTNDTLGKHKELFGGWDYVLADQLGGQQHSVYIYLIQCCIM